MIHLNGNIMAAIDVETTGRKPGFHEIIQICVLPLGFDLQPLKQINYKDGREPIKVSPFYTELKPESVENIDWDAMHVNRLELSELMLRALDQNRAADLFDKWFHKLQLPNNKKIVPLGCNWPFDAAFVRDWLGSESYEYYFWGTYRDVQTAALYLNDKFDAHNEPCPFPKVHLRYLASQLKINYTKAHDALSDCLVTAEVYKRLLRQSDYLHIPDTLSRMLKPYVKLGETAEDALKRILEFMPKENQ